MADDKLKIPYRRTCTKTGEILPKIHFTKDMAGLKYGKLNILKLADVQYDKNVVWECQCGCGNPEIVRAKQCGIVTGSVKSCGCSRKKFTAEEQKIKAKIYGKKWSKENPEKRLEYGRANEIRNKEKRRIQNKESRERTKDLRNAKRREYRKTTEAKEERKLYRKRPEVKRRELDADVRRRRERRKQDVAFRMMQNNRSRINQVIKRQNVRKCKKTLYLIGCTAAEFKTYIGNLFTEGMSWDNYGWGKGKWVIDHIKPCATFDLSIKENQIECFNYKNLQPLWYEDNDEKKDNIHWKKNPEKYKPIKRDNQ